MPDDFDGEFGEKVDKIPQLKHPDSRAPDVDTLPKYNKLPAMIDLYITYDQIEHVAQKLSGSEVLGEVDF